MNFYEDFSYYNDILVKQNIHMDLKKIYKWSDKGKYDKIINTINKLPNSELNFDLKNQLARAYNNIGQYDEAIRILMTQNLEGNNDAYWNYVIGYAFFYKANFEMALNVFEKSFSLGRKDTKDYIDKCKLYISNNNVEIKVFANKYKEFGFNISCIINQSNVYNENSRSYFKSPSHPWEDLFNLKQSRIEFEKYNWKNAVGIGTFTNWNNLICIDIDGCNDISFLKRILLKLNLPQDYEWVVESGSKNGYHIYYKGNKIEECENDDVVSSFPPKIEFEKYLDKIEFLWETHTVLPPSIHGSGNKYSFVNGLFPKKTPTIINTDTIYNFIDMFLDFDKIRVGGRYGEVMNLISSKTKFINDFEKEDITKHLLENVYLIMDIETSGLPIKNGMTEVYPEILQVAWILVNKSGVILKKNSFIIDTPYITKNNYSEFVNFDFEIARKVKFPISYIFKKLAEDIKICDFVVAHNIDFDVAILGHYFTKLYGINPFISKRQICTMKSTTNFCAISSNYGYKYPKLSELYFKLFNYQVQNSHNAEVDVLHTLKCFKKLQKIGIINYE